MSAIELDLLATLVLAGGLVGAAACALAALPWSEEELNDAALRSSRLLARVRAWLPEEVEAAAAPSPRAARLAPRRAAA